MKREKLKNDKYEKGTSEQMTLPKRTHLKKDKSEKEN